MKRLFMIGSLSLVATTGLVLAQSAQRDTKDSIPDCVDAKGTIRLPGDFHKWPHLGSWIVSDDRAPGHGFHDVYASPETATAYRNTGKFPDGAVIVKEISAIEQEDLTTGMARWAGQPKVWFVMVKDQRARFANHPNWGQGWGWALFKAADRTKNVSADYRKDCLKCHIPARDTDWIYVKGYAPLRGEQIH